MKKLIYKKAVRKSIDIYITVDKVDIPKKDIICKTNNMPIYIKEYKEFCFNFYKSLIQNK